MWFLDEFDLDPRDPKQQRRDALQVLALIGALLVLWACLMSPAIVRGAEPVGMSLASLNGARPINLAASSGVGKGLSTDNAAHVNEWIDEDNDARRLGLYVPGFGWSVKQTIELGAVDGLAIRGNGRGPLLAEASYGPGQPGGFPSRLVGTNDVDLAFPLAHGDANNQVLADVMLVGRTTRTTLADLTSLSGGRRAAGLDLDGNLIGTNVGYAFFESAILANAGARYTGRDNAFAYCEHAVEFTGAATVILAGGDGLWPGAILTAGGDGASWPVLIVSDMPIEGEPEALPDVEGEGRLEVIVANCQNAAGETVSAHYFWEDGETTSIEDSGEAAVPDPAAEIIYANPLLASTLTEAAGQGNAALYNVHYATGWTSGLPMEPLGKWQMVAQAADADDGTPTIDMGARTGQRLVARGGIEPIWHSLFHYDADNDETHGGPVAGVIDVSTDRTGATIKTAGIGNEIAIAGQGAYAVNMDTLVDEYPLMLDDFCHADHTGDVRKEIFVEIASVDGFGSGKPIFPRGLHGMFYRTVLKASHTDGFANHSDQGKVHGRMTGFFSDVLFHSDESMALAYHLPQLELGNARCGALIDAGGDLTIAEITMQAGSQYGVFVRGSEAGGALTGTITIPKVFYDNTAPVAGDPGWTGGNAQELVVRPSEYDEETDTWSESATYSPVHTIIEESFLWPDFATAVSPGPIATIIKSYARHVFARHFNLYDGAIYVRGGTQTHPTKIDVVNTTFYVGKHDATDQWKVLTLNNGESAYVVLTLRGNRELASGGGATTIYADVTYRGTLSRTAGTLSFTADP